MNFLCIHGHFYQPPRENPWLEAVEAQESAEPYHDWNERISAECYAPNTRCRILDDKCRITRLVNNYARISFNVGPTLLSWLEQHDPATYALILAADREGAARFGGHGPAIAQVYNHMIMPLANARDKRTQVAWGLADFQHRFGRMPEGMWLAETAADTASLEELAATGIKFTILSPYQAAKVRPVAGGEWADVTNGKVDTTRPYLANLPSGKSIAIFFYDGPRSQAIAFEKLLASGEQLATRLLGAFRKDEVDQLVHVATDGETYGHHFPHGDMALAFALDSIEKGGKARLTVYGEYLELHPPEFEVQIVENSSWSCSHGVGRWQSDCGCRISNKPGWVQVWRGPLRTALDRLRDRLAKLYEREAGELFDDPWAVRDDYIAVILDRRRERVDEFLTHHAGRPLSEEETFRALTMLEMQRHSMLMYTSCGWFFDELSGIETVQVMAYAGRAAQLAENLGLAGAETTFVADLAAAKSNVPHYADGRAIYDKLVRPMRVDLPKVAAHYALAALFEADPKQTPLFCYTATARDLRSFTGPAPGARLIHGRVRVTTNITRKAAEFAFAAAHLGDLNLRGGVRLAGDPETDAARAHALETAFRKPDLPEVLRQLDAEFDAAHFSLAAVFHDERSKLLAQILEPSEKILETRFRQIVDEYSPTMMLVQGLDTPLLPAFRNAARFVVQLDLRRALEAPDPDPEELNAHVEAATLWGVDPANAALNLTAQSAITRILHRLQHSPNDVALLGQLVRLLELMDSLGLKPDFWEAQNIFYGMAQSAAATLPAAARKLFGQLSERLKVRFVED
ncbi:MAG: DUF3536 domain-containing protein [Gemmataceae bacterium]